MHTEPTTIVIIGAGQAGGWAARTLRDEGFDGRVVLIGDESHPPYERPPLSKAVLAGEVAPESVHLLDAAAMAAMSVEWLASARVVNLDRTAKQVMLADGRAIGYDKLILCTGGRARELDVPGAGLPGVHTLRTIDDARRLGPVLQRDAHVAVVGGGWIGLEVAATARQRGAEVTVIETMGRLCERSLPEAMSAHLHAMHAAKGVEVLLGAAVASFAPRTTGGLDVVLSDGRSITCDAAVVGIGLVPNDELARAAGLDCEGGVLVDAQCRTTDPDIFAAGDVAVTPNSWAGRRLRLESWQNAQEQGIAAVRSALGRDVHYDPLPWFWSDQHGTNVQIYGVPSPTHEVVVRGDPAAGSFVFFYLEGERVMAALGGNAARELRFARRLIEKRTQVRAQDLADPGVSLAKL
ncbi:NAD(P)/FAD-dependent oxidoreductase [Cupriavidus consociatus]|uniref:NAD(P)/FAD-dependent oxidoreductase n=1 Tax=Cupriavidus consociatus TaxID=2821357 RepID=UPI001AE786A3|nr:MULTISPECIES: FAD-dependent oxidoreductase [unclassified Cupriavidus]MBP0623698.1 FAD-dependent oxidoreductase [Cupriavidus sp. LEh25]MDK2660402.1 FAD-dependent oxidoreductase [Cupriavidus sp. LEh21]